MSTGSFSLLFLSLVCRDVCALEQFARHQLLDTSSFSTAQNGRFRFLPTLPQLSSRMASLQTKQAPKFRKHEIDRRQKIYLLLLSLGYGGSMIAFRPTLMISMPVMLQDLGLGLISGGVILSTSQISYMVAKPVSQAVSDNVDPLVLLMASEIATCVCFCLFPFASTLRHLNVLVAALMICQAPHAPAANRLVTSGFAPRQRGTAFSALNAAANVVSCALPLIVTSGLSAFGSWTHLYFVIGAAMGSLALCQGILLLKYMQQAPQEHVNRPNADLLDIASTRIVWIIGLNYAFLYFIRMGIEGWIGTFILEKLGTSSLVTAASFLFWWQVGGVIGSTIAGPLVDWRSGCPSAISILFALLLLGCTSLLWPVSMSGVAWHFRAFAFIGGTTIYSTRIFLTLSTRTFFNTRECGKADAITNCLGELGGAIAGVPLMQLVHRFGGWHAYTAALTAGAIVLCTFQAALIACEKSHYSYNNKTF